MPSVLPQYTCCTNSTNVVLNKQVQKYENNRKSMETQELSASILFVTGQFTISPHPLSLFSSVRLVKSTAVWRCSGFRWMQLRKLRFKTQHFDTAIQYFHHPLIKVWLSRRPCWCTEKYRKNLWIWFYFYAKLERHFATVSYTNMAISSGEWKPKIRTRSIAMLGLHAIPDSSNQVEFVSTIWE